MVAGPTSTGAIIEGPKTAGTIVTGATSAGVIAPGVVTSGIVAPGIATTGLLGAGLVAPAAAGNIFYSFLNRIFNAIRVDTSNWNRNSFDLQVFSPTEVVLSESAVSEL